MSGEAVGVSVGVVDDPEQTYIALTINSKDKVRQILLMPDRAMALHHQLATILTGLGLYGEEDEDEDDEGEGGGECSMH